MENKDYLKTPLPSYPGPELDLLVSLHLGMKTLQSGGKVWLLKGSRAYSVPPFSTDHNAFFEHLVPLLREKNIRVTTEDAEDHVVVTCEFLEQGFLYPEQRATLPHAGCVAAIRALRELEKKAPRQIGPQR